MLQPFVDALIPFMPGYLELPESYVGLLKGASHRYIKRVPKPGGGYRYFYHVGHGGGVSVEDHFVPGASFRFEGGHFHIKSEEGGKLVIEHDETKERKTVSKSELRDMLGAHHEPAIKAHREKVAGMLAEAKANKASPKQIARLEARAKAAGAGSKSSEELRADVERTKSELDKVIGDIMAIANKKELRPGDKAKVKEWLNLVAKHGRDGTPVPAMNKRDVYGKHRHSIMWAYSDDSRGLAGVRQDRVYDAAKAHGDALRAAGPEQDPGSEPKMSQAIADAAVAKDREKQRAAAAKFEAKQKSEGSRSAPTERERAWISHLRQLSDKHGKASSRAKTSDASRKQSGLASFYDWTADHFEGKTKEPPKPGHRLGMVITGPSSAEAKGVPDERNTLTADEFAEAKRGLEKLGDPAKFATESEQSEAHVAQREAKDKRDREARIAARTAEIKALEASERERKKRDWMGP